MKENLNDMKNKITLLLFLLVLSLGIFAQAPEKINYQAVARNLTGNPLINQAVGLEFNIRQGSPTGAVVYSETHTGVSTNQFGLFTAEIGGGTVNSGVFSAINWGLSSFYLQVTIDGNILPATQLLSVPFALYAKESANGPTGASGHNTLMNSTPEPAGTNCINGGYFIQTWLDLDDDGALSTGETPISYYVCNGTDGANGLPGTNGANGVDGVSIDSTINNNDGTFSIYYSNGTSFTTSDLTGPAGTSGTTYFAGNGISLSGDTITNLGDLDNNPTNELQTLSLQNDTLFLSNGNYVVLPTSSTSFWSTNGSDIYNSNIGKVGIGTTTIPHQLTVVSTDTVIASFTGSNPYGSVIAVWGFNPNAIVGSVYLTGSDSGIVVMNPTQKTFQMTNTTPGGHTVLYADSTVALYGKVVGNIASDLIYNQTTRIYNETDTIYSYSPSGTIVNVNQGLFLTDSLYVLGSNAINANWVLANDGLGQAKWTDPSTIFGSVGDNWGLQVVIHDTTLTGTGIAGTPLSVNPNIIPTQTSQLTNNSGFITSPNDADTSVTNELQVLSFSNDTLFLSNGNAIYLPPAAGDNWGADSVTTAGANISGSGTTANPLMVLDNDTSATNELQNLSNGGKVGNNQTINISGGTGVTFSVADADSSATNELQTISKIGSIVTLSNGGGSFTDDVNDADNNPANEIQNLSLVGDTLSISGGNSVNLSTLSGTTYTAGAGINLTGDSITNTAPDQTVVITGAGTTSVTSAYPSFIITSNDNDTSATNELQNLSNTISPGTVTIDITGGTSTTFSIDDADANPSNELITSFGVNGTNDSLVIKEAGNDWAVPLTSFSAAGKWTENAGNLYPTTLTNNVGIGTSTPSTKLNIVDSVSFRPEVLLETFAGNFKIGYRYKTALAEWSMGQGEATGQQFRISDIQTGTTPFVIEQGSGNVGIGTTSPESMLHVALPNTANHKAFQLGHGNQPTLEWLFKVDEFSLFSIANENNGTEFTAMVIDANNGNVGIGSTTANSKLDVQNADNNVYAFSSIHTGINAHAGYFQINNAANNLNAVNATTNGAGAAINASNNYNGANAIRDGIYVTVTGAGGPITTNKAGYFSASGAANNYAAIFDQGNVGIGTGSPSAKLHLEGSLRLNNLSGTAPAIGSVLTSIDAQGNAEWAPPSGAVNVWNLNGNTGTIDGTHFIGTTDNVPLNFRVNNVQAGRIDASLSNTFYGYWAGRDNTTGSQNTAIGTNALILNTTGTQNTAIGASALSNNTGSYNTATGYFTLQNNTGTYNTATGHSALGNNTSGNQNTATGMSALYSNTTGSDNTASGQYALVSNINGNFNIATGKNALYSNNSGSTNVATGTGALYNNTTGNSNTANGHSALYSVTGAGTGNTALGYNAGFSGTAITTGTYNTFIGYNASSNSATRTNSIVIAGNGNLPLPADNSVRIGNSSMGSIGGQVGWTTVSDERVKVNVNEDVKGLAFIMKLKPVTYNYSIAKSNLLQGKTEDISDWKGKYDIEKMRFSGFLSQEVEKAAKESDYNFSGVDKPQDSEGMWGLRYAEFTVPLVKAVQEQQKMIEEQLKMIEELKKEVEALKNKE